MLGRPPKKPGGKEVDDADTTIVILQVTTLTLEYTTKTTTNSLKNAETAPLAVYAAPSTWEGHVQTASKGCENNKVPIIVLMKPMNNATRDSKKKAPLTLQDIEEEMAQGLGLMRHPLQFKPLRQLNEFQERKLRRKSAYIKHFAIYFCLPTRLLPPSKLSPNIKRFFPFPKRLLPGSYLVWHRSYCSANEDPPPQTPAYPIRRSVLTVPLQS